LFNKITCSLLLIFNMFIKNIILIISNKTCGDIDNKIIILYLYINLDKYIINIIYLYQFFICINK
jgi:hypothetical protein